MKTAVLLSTPGVRPFLSCVTLFVAGALQAQVTRTWVGTTASLAVTNNWNPAGVPSATDGDSLVFDGSSAQNALTFPYNVFHANNGLGDITVSSGQIANLSITCSGGAGNNVFRLLPGKALTVAPGAGAFSMGAGGSAFWINLGQSGNGNLFANDSASVATLGSRSTINATGGGGGRAILGGSGDWRVDGNFTAAVDRGLYKTGAGSLTLTAQNLHTGGTVISNGTLRIAHAQALGSGSVSVESDGVLDLTLLPSGSAVTNTITGTGALRVRGNQAVTLDGLSPAALRLQVDVAGLSQTAYTVLRRAGTAFTANTFAAAEWLNAAGTTAAFNYGTASELRLEVQSLPGEAAWDGESAEDGFWSTAANWSGDSAPSAWSRLTFSGAASLRRANTNNLSAGTFHSLTLADQDWSLAGNALTLGKVDLATAQAAALGMPLALIGDAVMSVSSGGTLTVSATVSGDQGLLKSGPGKLKLTAASSYVGGTQVSGGTLQIGNNNAFGSGPITFVGDADIETTFNDVYLPNRIAVSEGVTARLRRYQANNSTTRLNGGLSGPGTLEVGGQFTTAEYGTRLNGSNAGFTGTLRVNAFADLRIEDDTAQMGAFLPGASLELNGGTLCFDIDTNRTYAIGQLTSPDPATNSLPTIRGNRNRAHTLSVGSLNRSGSFAGRIIDGIGTVGLTKVGSGTLTLTGISSYSGATAVQAGTLRIERPAAFPQPLGFWPMSEGAGSTITNTVPGSPSGALNNSPAWIAGPGGAGTYGVQFDGTNQWGSINTAGHPLHDVGTGALTVSAWVKTATAGTWYRSLVSKFDDRATTPFWGLGWFGASQLGVVVRTASGNQTSAHSGAAALDGAWHHLVGVRESDNTLRIYLDGLLYSSAAGPAGSCKEDRPLWICRHSSYVNAAVAGVGVWGQALTAEQVKALYVSSLASALTVAAGATVQFVGGASSVGSLGDSGGSGGNVVLDGAALTVGRNGASTTFSGNVSGTGSLIKTGAGTLTLSGTFCATGDLTVAAGALAIGVTGTVGSACTNIAVSGGTLAISHSAALADTATVTVSASGKVDLSAGVDDVVGTLMFGAVRQPAGTYGSTASGAQVKNDTTFSGTGMLRLIPHGALLQVR